jgi:type II secretory pathway pseudopilin PulG
MSKEKKYFNMIEVTLAIAIVGLGIAGIMSLFPVGLNATRDAVGDNYAADSAEDFLNYISQAAQADWTIITGGGLTTSKATDRGSSKWNTDDWDHDKDGDSNEDTDAIWKITGVSDIWY